MLENYRIKVKFNVRVLQTNDVKMSSRPKTKEASVKHPKSKVKAGALKSSYPVS